MMGFGLAREERAIPLSYAFLRTTPITRTAPRSRLASFVMDQPGRGRSGFDQSVLHEAKATGNWDMIPTFGRVTDNGAWT
jgi:hypothetical protein